MGCLSDRAIKQKLQKKQKNNKVVNFTHPLPSALLIPINPSEKLGSAAGRSLLNLPPLLAGFGVSGTIVFWMEIWDFRKEFLPPGSSGPAADPSPSDPFWRQSVHVWEVKYPFFVALVFKTIPRRIPEPPNLPRGSQDASEMTAKSRLIWPKNYFKVIMSATLVSA